MADILARKQQALKGASKLQKKSIQEIKSLPRAPDLVETLVQTQMILLQEPAREWKKMMAVYADPTLLFNKLADFNCDTIPDAVLLKANASMKTPDFTEEAMKKKSSAAGALSAWVIGIVTAANLQKEAEIIS